MALFRPKRSQSFVVSDSPPLMSFSHLLCGPLAVSVFPPFNVSYLCCLPRPFSDSPVSIPHSLLLSISVSQSEPPNLLAPFSFYLSLFPLAIFVSLHPDSSCNFPTLSPSRCLCRHYVSLFLSHRHSLSLSQFVSFSLSPFLSVYLSLSSSRSLSLSPSVAVSLPLNVSLLLCLPLVVSLSLLSSPLSLSLSLSPFLLIYLYHPVSLSPPLSLSSSVAVSLPTNISFSLCLSL